MKILKGVTASPGLASGMVCLYSEKAEEEIPHYAIEPGRAEDEIRRFDAAQKSAMAVMKRMVEASENLFDKKASEIFNAHLMILEDHTLRDDITRLIKTKLVNAEHAVSDAFAAYMERFEKKEFHFAELAHDIADVRDRLLSAFGNVSGRFECPEGDRHPVIVASRRLTPSMVLGIPRQNVLAFITEEGGFTTHATILARSYGVPVIFGLDIIGNLKCADRAIVDGFHATVFVSPDRETQDEYSGKIDDLKKKRSVCAVRKEEPSQTKKGSRIRLKANISMPGEMELAKGLNYDGIGLLRTEFLFRDKDRPPTEDEQLSMYRHIVEGAEGREVNIRLLDIGADKLPVYLELPEQDNPDMGIRGARTLDFFGDIYLTQVKAILRASAYGDVRILYPMVSDVGDINSFKDLTRKAGSLIGAPKKRRVGRIKEGAMIETPSAALMAEAILEHVDFVNIGSNDLLQYTLAASRGNIAVEKRYHILHPSLIRLLEIVAKSANGLKKEACLCGEIAGFDEFYPLFLGIGLRSFSVAASKLQDIKCELLQLRGPDRSLTKKLYSAVTKDDVDRIFKG